MGTLTGAIFVRDRVTSNNVTASKKKDDQSDDSRITLLLESIPMTTITIITVMIARMIMQIGSTFRGLLLGETWELPF